MYSIVATIRLSISNNMYLFHKFHLVHCLWFCILRSSQTSVYRKFEKRSKCFKKKSTKFRKYSSTRACRSISFVWQVVLEMYRVRPRLEIACIRFNVDWHFRRRSAGTGTVLPSFCRSLLLLMGDGNNLSKVTKRPDPAPRCILLIFAIRTAANPSHLIFVHITPPSRVIQSHTIQYYWPQTMCLCCFRVRTNIILRMPNRYQKGFTGRQRNSFSLPNK